MRFVNIFIILIPIFFSGCVNIVDLSENLQSFNISLGNTNKKKTKKEIGIEFQKHFIDNCYDNGDRIELENNDEYSALHICQKITSTSSNDLLELAILNINRTAEQFILRKSYSKKIEFEEIIKNNYQNIHTLNKSYNKGFSTISSKIISQGTLSKSKFISIIHDDVKYKRILKSIKNYSNSSSLYYARIPVVYKTIEDIIFELDVNDFLNNNIENYELNTLDLKRKQFSTNKHDKNNETLIKNRKLVLKKINKRLEYMGYKTNIIIKYNKNHKLSAELIKKILEEKNYKLVEKKYLNISLKETNSVINKFYVTVKYNMLNKIKPYPLNVFDNKLIEYQADIFYDGDNNTLATVYVPNTNERKNKILNFYLNEKITCPKTPLWNFKEYVDYNNGERTFWKRRYKRHEYIPLTSKNLKYGTKVKVLRKNLFNGYSLIEYYKDNKIKKGLVLTISLPYEYDESGYSRECTKRTRKIFIKQGIKNSAMWFYPKKLKLRYK